MPGLRTAHLALGRMSRVPAAALIAAVMVLAPYQAAAQTKIVAITQIVSHPELDLVRRGVIEGLAAAGWRDGDTIRLIARNARGDVVRAAEIAAEFEEIGADVIVPISTPSAEAVVGIRPEQAVVCAAVSNAAAAGLVPGPDHPGLQITGVADPTPLKATIELIREVLPEARWIGFLRSEGERSTEIIHQEFSKWAPSYNYRIVEGVIPSPAELEATVQDLAESVDVIYMPPDNGVALGREKIMEVALRERKPVIAASAEFVRAGAVAGLGVDYYSLGREVGAIVSRVLAGTNPNDIPPRADPETDLFINLAAAQELELRIPQNLLDSANEVYR